MASDLHYYFDNYRLDVANRQLWQNDEQLDLNGRYFDALVLLVDNHGQLVEKDQFFSEVWDDVVVSDSALTQCIKDIRKQLKDRASDPSYVETVPGYGYRFIGSVTTRPAAEDSVEKKTPNKRGSSPPVSDSSSPLQRFLMIGGAGTLGGIAAGLMGGLIYGFGLAFAPGSTGAASMLLVLLSLNALIGGMGGLGVSFGMAAGKTLSNGRKVWTICGAALGGLIVGALVKLLGVDAFNLLFGIAPDGITGGIEGMAVGGAVALGAVMGGGIENRHNTRPLTTTAVTSGVAGIVISLAGGRLMAGSLELLTQSFSGSQLRLDVFGAYFGESDFGFITQTALSGIEGLVFGVCVVGGMLYLNRIWPR